MLSPNFFKKNRYKPKVEYKEDILKVVAFLQKIDNSAILHPFKIKAILITISVGNSFR